MKRAISIMLVFAMCMSLFSSAVLAAPSKVQIHIDGDKPEGIVQVAIGDEINEEGESSGGHITIDREPGDLEDLVGETVVVTEDDGDVFEGVLENRGNDNDNENGTDNYWVKLTKQDTEEPEPEAEYVPIDVDYDCEDDCVLLTDDDDYADHEDCEVEKFDDREHHYFAKVGDTLDENIELYVKDGEEFKKIGTPLSIANFENHTFCQACTEDDNDDDEDDEIGMYGVTIEKGKQYDLDMDYHAGTPDPDPDPEEQEMTYTVTAHYYEVRNGVESFVATETYNDTYYGEEGESIRAEVYDYNTYGGRTYEFDADNENNVETIQISKDSSKNQFVLYYEIVIEEKDITVNYVDTEGNEIADSNTVTVDKNTDTEEWANESRSEIPETIMKDGDKYVKVDVIVDGDTVTVVYEKQEEQTKVDAIQVIMSDGVKEMYDELKGAKWVHVDNDKSVKGYYEMGLNLWNDNSYDCTEDDITGVTMSSAWVGSPKLYFSMDGDNGIFAKVEVSYGKTYNPADVFHLLGEYDTMFLYCQLVSERDGEVLPETAKYTVKANYLTLDENGSITDSAANVTVDSGEAEVGSTVTVDPAKYTVYDGNAYTFHSAAAGTSVVIVKGTNEIVLNYNRTVDGGSGNPDEVDYKVVAYYKTVNGGSSDIVSVVLKEGKGKVGDVITIDPEEHLKNGGFEFTLDKDNVGNTEGFTITLGENSNLNILNVNYIRDITDDGGDDGDEDITDPEPPLVDPEVPGDGDEDITDSEPPLVDPEIPGDGEDITDPEVPTTNPDLPKTGGMTGFALLAAGLAATAAGVVIRKR